MIKILPPLPPEQQAYALARYSRSSDSIEDSLKWVYAHDEKAFLSNYAFQYGHASIKDLGHVSVCFEGVSDLAAQHILGYDLIDAQCKSTRYQDFSKCAVQLPPGIEDYPRRQLASMGSRLLSEYETVIVGELGALEKQHPRPDHMSQDSYLRTLLARALDVARYLLPMGIPTSLGIVCSIRTLERIAGDALVDPYPEVRAIGQEIVEACADVPLWRSWRETGVASDLMDYLDSDKRPVLPTLAANIQPNEHLRRVRYSAAMQGRQYPPFVFRESWQEDPDCGRVSLASPGNLEVEALASLRYSHCGLSYQSLLCLFRGPDGHGDPPADLATMVGAGEAGAHPADLAELRAGLPFQFELGMDHGAWRDLRRHRRCVQLRKHISCDSMRHYLPPFPAHPESRDRITETWAMAVEAAQNVAQCDPWASHYLLPMCHGISAVFKMDLAELMYIVKLRTGKKGHDAYRRIAWLMGETARAEHPNLAGLIQGTDPAERDPLIR